MSKTRQSDKTIDIKFTNLLREAEKAETESQIQQVLAKVTELKKSVVVRKHNIKEGQARDSSTGEGRLFAECERVIGDRLKKMRRNISAINTSKTQNPNSKGQKNTLKDKDNTKNKISRKQYASCHITNQDVSHHKEPDFELTKSRCDKLETQLDRSIETIQKQKEEIDMLKRRIHSQQDLHVERILHPQLSPADLDRTLDQPRHKVELWERDTNLNQNSTLLRQKQRIMDRYEDRLAQKNVVITELKQDVISLQTQLNTVKQENKLYFTQVTKQREDLKRMVDSLTQKLECSIREKDQLRRLNHQYRQKSLLQNQQLETLIVERNLVREALHRDQSILKEELLKKEKESRFMKVSVEPRMAQEKIDRFLLLQRIQQSQTQLQKLKNELQEGEQRNKLLIQQLNHQKEKINEFEHKYSEKKMKYSDLKKELERVKSQTIFRTSMHRSASGEELRRSEQMEESDKNIQRRIRALEGIKSMIRRFPR